MKIHVSEKCDLENVEIHENVTNRYAVFVSNNKDFITEVEQVQQVMTLNDVRNHFQVISYHLFKCPLSYQLPV